MGTLMGFGVSKRRRGLSIKCHMARVSCSETFSHAACPLATITSLKLLKPPGGTLTFKVNKCWKTTMPSVMTG